MREAPGRTLLADLFAVGETAYDPIAMEAAAPLRRRSVTALPEQSAD
jgi:hypothetical protein